MSPFAGALAVTDRIQDQIYGERVLVEPRADVAGDKSARRTADPARPALTITGVWTEPHAAVYVQNRTGHPDAEGMRVGDSKPSVDFVTAALPYRLQQGDRVTRIGTGTAYEVADVNDDGFSRTTVALTARKRP